MLKYALILLLINTYNCGWSIPLQLPNGKAGIATNTFASNFHLLASTCQNKLISYEIKSKSAICSLSLPEMQTFKCWTFYDINKQLCNSSLLKLEDFNVQINKKLDVKQFCNDTASWPVTDLKINPQYSKTFKMVFSNTNVCIKLCESQEFINEDVDFYCKYYKWGLDVLAKAKLDNVEKSPSINSGSAPTASHNNVLKQEGNIKNASDDLVSNTVNEQNNNPKRQDLKLSTQAAASGQEAKLVSDGKPKVNNILDRQSPSEVSLDPGVDTNQNLGTTNNENSMLARDGDRVTTEKLKMNDSNHLEDTPNVDLKQQRDEEDIVDNGQDSDRNISNTQDSDDITGTDKIHSNENIDSVNPSRNSQREGIQKEENSNAMQDSIMEDEDDHFFILFLTGVIFVILLYVLYHNKNKVSKVVMGLIVEGRAGRRRNSRGHAYRRLDTLEQAVSASHPTPPTKIIY